VREVNTCEVVATYVGDLTANGIVHRRPLCKYPYCLNIGRLLTLFEVQGALCSSKTSIARSTLLARGPYFWSQNELLSDMRISEIASGNAIEKRGKRTARRKTRRNVQTSHHERRLPTDARKSPRLGNAQRRRRGMPGGICWLFRSEE
jgi:hypothetical protein